jgi:hypothetical protein
MVRLRSFNPWCLQFSQQTMVNKEAIESLGYRVEVLVESLCAPTSEGDINEEMRRKELERQVHPLPDRV